MSFKRIILYVNLVLCFTQCKKDKAPAGAIPPKPIDTLKPLSYYPVFPGSYWIYINENGDTIKHSTLPTYIKDCFAHGYVDTALVPFLYDSKLGTKKPIYQYDDVSEFRPTMSGVQNIWRTPFLSEVKGATFKLGGMDSRYGDHRPIATIRGKEIINGDSVLILDGAYDNKPNVFTEYYTKDIGLTWRYETNPANNDTISQLRLVKFYVNK